MYEITLSVQTENIDWLEEAGRRVSETFGSAAVTACDIGERRSLLSVGCDDRMRRPLEAGLKTIIADLCLGKIKYGYIEKGIRRAGLAAEKRTLLCHALCVFEREAEREILLRDLEIGTYFDINGFYYFRMGELISRWSDICALAAEHISYLSDEGTLNELLRFLVGAGAQSDCRAEIFLINGRFRLVEHTRGQVTAEHLYDRFEELLCRLIDIAPCETVLSGFGYGSPFRTLAAIFDVKRDILR